VKPSWRVADPICTLLFATLVLFTTWGMLAEVVDVLMERTPKGVNIPVCALLFLCFVSL
jgi:Co/Zn/Cd efflux system component